MNQLKVFIVSFPGPWFEGRAVVVASHATHAKQLLLETLQNVQRLGTPTTDAELDVEELQLTAASVHVLNDGDE